MSKDSSKKESTKQNCDQSLQKFFLLLSKKLVIKSEDIIAFTTLMSLVYFGIKHIFTIKAMKSIELNDGIHYFLSSDKIVFDYWNIFPELLILSIVISIAVCIMFGLTVSALRDNVEKIDSFVSDKSNFKYTFGAVIVFAAVMLWGNPIIYAVFIVFVLFAFRMRVLIRYSIINALVLSMLAGYTFSASSDAPSVERSSQNEIVSVTLVGESPQDAEIIASLTDWLLLEIDGREVLVPTSQIQKIDLGKRNCSED